MQISFVNSTAADSNVTYQFVDGDQQSAQPMVVETVPENVPYTPGRVCICTFMLASPNLASFSFVGSGAGDIWESVFGDVA